MRMMGDMTVVTDHPTKHMHYQLAGLQNSRQCEIDSEEAIHHSAINTRVPYLLACSKWYLSGANPFAKSGKRVLGSLEPHLQGEFFRIRVADVNSKISSMSSQ